MKRGGMSLPVRRFRQFAKRFPVAQFDALSQHGDPAALLPGDQLAVRRFAGRSREVGEIALGNRQQIAGAAKPVEEAV